MKNILTTGLTLGLLIIPAANAAIECPAGYEDVSGVCSPCQPGYYKKSAGTASCGPCPGGTYASGTGTTTCTECTNYTYSERGSTECTLPPPGYNSAACGSNGNGCYAKTTCGYGYYCPGDGKYHSCPSNKTTTTDKAEQASDCVCKKGYRLSGTSCVKCDEGTYKDVASNATSCTSCGSNKTSSVTGSTSATDCVCKAGYTGANCTACEKGTWKSTTGDAACTACGANMTTATTGATSKDACICADGYELQNGKCVKSGPDLCGDGYTELHTENGLSFKVWAEKTTEHALVLQRAGSDVKCYVNLAADPATAAINVQIGEDVYHTTN